MNRVLWFGATLSLDSKAFAKALERSPITEERDMGFRVERVRRDRVEGMHFERFSWVEESVDPFGRASTTERTTYKSVRFSLSQAFPQLELVDSPRGLRSFFSSLAEVTDFGIAVAPLSIDVESWLRALRKLELPRFRVSGMTVSDLHVDDGIRGQLSVISGQKDVESAVGRLLSKRSYAVKKMHLSFPTGSVYSPVVISADASVKSQAELNPDLVEALRTALVSVQR